MEEFLYISSYFGHSCADARFPYKGICDQKYTCSFKDPLNQNYLVYDAIKHKQDIVYFVRVTGVNKNHVLLLRTAEPH